jgi:predicted RNA-binding Zn ribbon-like protein
MMEASSLPAFQLVAGHPALDFINTLDWRFREDGPEELLNSYEDLIRFVEQSKLVSAKQARQLTRIDDGSTQTQVLDRCIKLREVTAEVFYAGVDQRVPCRAALRTLARYFKTAHLHQNLCWKESRLEWNWSGMERDPQLPLWLLSLSMSDLMTSDAVYRLRACDNPECRWLFLDTSKNHTRRWCDMKLCGNRMKARRFKAQRKT